MKKELVIILAALSTAAMAAQPSVTFNKEVDYTPAPNAGNANALVTRPSGGVVMVDGYDDGVFRIKTPLTTDGTNDNAANTWGVNVSADLARGFGSGQSFSSVTFDGTNYYAIGTIGATSVMFKLTDSGNDTTRWTPGVKVTIPTAGYSGVTAVGTNNLVVCNYATGALQFIDGAGTASGAPIANPNAAGLNALNVVYYSGGTTKYIFELLGSATVTRRVDVFVTNGTAAGTSYAGTFAPGIASNMPVSDATYNQKWATLNVSNTKKVLAVAVNAATAGGTANGVDLFDLFTVTATGSATPYSQVRDAGTANFNSASQKNIAGIAFFTNSATDDQLAVTHANHLSIFNVGTAAVNDWTLY